MKLGPEDLDGIWQSGYCDKTVANARIAEGPEERMKWMAEHVLGCQECRYADTLKGIEARVAERLGRVAEFNRGEDVSRMRGFQDAFRPIMERAMRSGEVTPRMLAWIAHIACTRAGQPWPGRLA